MLVYLYYLSKLLCISGPGEPGDPGEADLRVGGEGEGGHVPGSGGLPLPHHRVVDRNPEPPANISGSREDIANQPDRNQEPPANIPGSREERAHVPDRTNLKAKANPSQLQLTNQEEGQLQFTVPKRCSRANPYRVDTSWSLHTCWMT